MKSIKLEGIDFSATFTVDRASNDQDEPLDSVFLQETDVTDLVSGMYYKDRVVGAKGFETKYLNVADELQKEYCHE